MEYKTCRRCGKIIKQGKKCECQIERERKRNREYTKEYEEENSEFTKPIKTNRYKRFRQDIINRDKGYCQRCKNLLGLLTTENLEVHHIKPRSKYPELIFESSNVITLCKQCNLALGVKEELDFKPDINLSKDRDYFFF